MVILVLFTLALSWVSSALAGLVSAGRALHAPSSMPSDWTQFGSSTSTDDIEFTFVLKGNDYAGLAARMEKASLEDGTWLTLEELTAYVRPSEDTKTALDAAVLNLGPSYTAYSSIGDKLTIKTTVRAASKVPELILPI